MSACTICGEALLEYEETQPLCLECADGLSIARICDRRVALDSAMFDPDPNGAMRRGHELHAIVGEMVAREGRDHPNCRSINVPPRHAMSSAFDGIDRSVAPGVAGSWLNTATPPFDAELFREGMRQMLERKPSPPYKPRITRVMAEQLKARGYNLEWYEIIDP